MTLDPGAARVGAFIVVSLFLVIGSDFETTAPLAVAFAYLILLSALLAAGPRAFGNVQDLFSTKAA